MLTGDRISGAEAAAWGLAYRAVPGRAFERRSRSSLERLAAKSRGRLRRIKALVHEGLERPLADGIDHEIEAVLAHLQGGSAGAGIEGFTSR